MNKVYGFEAETKHKHGELTCSSLPRTDHLLITRLLLPLVVPLSCP
jgi:hypothetical protein